jgi:Cu(I)/Ag(I) efflux system membrane fusion protein
MRLLGVLAIATFCLMGLACSGRKGVQAGSRRILYYHDPMHPSYRSNEPGVAPDCKMPLTPVYADDSPNTGIPVDERQAAAIGLRTEPAREEVVTGELRAVGRVEPRESGRFVVTAGADGWMRRIYSGESGSTVRAGQPLASYYSRDVASPQQAYLYALDAQSRLPATATAAQRDLAALQTSQARDYLEYLGLTSPQIAVLAAARREEREVTLGAPASGLVLERNVSEGDRFARGDALWVIADIEFVWVAAELFPDDLRSVADARSATVILPGGAQLRAAIDRSLPRFETADRIAKLRLMAENRSRQLLPGMIVTVTLPRSPVTGLTVPADAVIESGIRPRVFVRRGDGAFEPRSVSTGRRSGGRQQILSGLRAGEEVVTAGAFLIDSESRLR